MIHNLPVKTEKNGVKISWTLANWDAVIIQNQSVSSPVDGVSVRGPDELLQKVLDVPAQPLVLLLQVEHLVHQQQHHPQRDVIVHLPTGLHTE